MSIMVNIHLMTKVGKSSLHEERSGVAVLCGILTTLCFPSTYIVAFQIVVFAY